MARRPLWSVGSGPEPTLATGRAGRAELCHDEDGPTLSRLEHRRLRALGVAARVGRLHDRRELARRLGRAALGEQFARFSRKTGREPSLAGFVFFDFVFNF